LMTPAQNRSFAALGTGDSRSRRMSSSIYDSTMHSQVCGYSARAPWRIYRSSRPKRARACR
jgi:hypothetical protein